jgi:hypothetical protein
MLPVLTPAQLDRYRSLRGYAGREGGPQQHHRRHH